MSTDLIRHVVVDISTQHDHAILQEARENIGTSGAIAGIGALATVSAPTALALSLARQAHLKLAALASRGVMIFDRN